MVKPSQENYRFESTNLISLIWKKRKPLLIISFVAAVLSAVVSLTITPRFKSAAIIFPASQAPVSKSLLSATYQDRTGILSFGEEEHLERMLQVLHSDRIRDRIISQFDLMRHYDIDSTGPYPLTQLYGEYKSNMEFSRTRYNSVQVEVLDKDPEIAAEIVNTIVALVDTTMNKMKKERARQAFTLVKTEYSTVRERIGKLEDSLGYFRNKGIVHFESQAERLNEAWAKAVAEGNTKGAQKVKEKLEIMYQNAGDYLYYRDMLEYEKRRLSDLENKLMEARAELNQKLSHIYVLDHGYAPEKKATPKRSIIVIVSTLSAFLLALIIFLVVNNLRAKTAD